MHVVENIFTSSMRGKKFFTFKKVVFGLGFALLSAFFILYAPDIVLSQSLETDDFGVTQIGAGTGFQATDIRLVIARIVRTALGFLGTIAFLLCLYAGFVWMTAGGSEDKIGQAKKILLNAAIGLVVIASAYGLTTFLITQLLEAVNGSAANVSSTGMECTGSDCLGGSGGFTGNVFYVSSLPASGAACVQNVHPAVVFNRDVDVATVQDAIQIQKKSDASRVEGEWRYGARKSSIIFVPTATCAGSTSTTGCFEPSTGYQVQFKNTASIKSLDNLSLNCSLKAGCRPVDFTSGTGVETRAPRVVVLDPASSMSFPVGDTIPFTVSYTSDSGVQNVSLYQGNALVGVQSVSGCAVTGTVVIAWNTAGNAPGSYTLESSATGWSGLNGAAQTSLTLAPLHCFDTTLDSNLGEIQKGPPACGGVCGSCAGGSCTSNSQCASGFCDVSSGAGICVDKMKITDVSPRTGAPGTYVTIAGTYFGTTTGAVYFAKVSNPNPANLAQWVKANQVQCVVGGSTWTSSQVIVEVPKEAVSGPILVITAPQKGVAGTAITVSDATNDAWGPRLGDFLITTQVRPGLCGLKPDQGIPGESVQVVGKNFGQLNSATDGVQFDDIKSVVTPVDWTDEMIKTTVPLQPPHAAAVKVISDGVESNAVRFVVSGGENATNPLISAVSPQSGAAGEYITINGKNFGANVGSVWFKQTPQSEAVIGDFSFPESCRTAVWRDDQVIVKFPKDKGVVGTVYSIQIKTADNKISSLDTVYTFTLKGGSPAPGICKISPNSGTSPFPANQTMTIFGEYFGTNPQVFFWKTGAGTSTLENRLLVSGSAIVAARDTSIELTPPSGIATGPVVVTRAADKLVSNPEQFQVVDCVKNNNTCPVSGSVCCARGPEAGLCKPAGELCEGELRSTAYIWRFSTNDIPKVPRVVERCDAQVETGVSLPSPAPSVQWSSGSQSDDQVNVCRTALATIEFSTALDPKTINNQSVALMKCASVSGTVCLNPVPVSLTPESFTLETAASEQGSQVRNYLSLAPSAGKFEDSTWYQVTLAKTISSAPIAGKTLPLQADRPCSSDSAYCFVFKTGNQDCKMKAVVITPYTYWTSFLEAPIKYRSGGYETVLEYKGNGLSTQRCIMMNVSSFGWTWGTGDKKYADIFGPATTRIAQASAIANTVGVGLSNPDDAVAIRATAQQGTAAYVGKSPLTIDLNNPEIVDYWPKCLEACSAAEVAVKFNTSMSNRNIPGAAAGGSIQLLKCLDENCFSTVSVLTTEDVFLDQASNYTLLKIANSRAKSPALEPNTLYQVVVSASSTDPNTSLRQVWSAARLNEPSTYSRPYNKQFVWRFKTKRDSCRIDRVEVAPREFVATSIKDRSTYQVQPYSSPDSCSASGQKLNPWSVGWNWSSSDEKVATLSTFNTRGAHPACTAQCVRRGSDVPATAATSPLCGNGVVEAGEDCDGPDKTKGCSLDCRFMGSTATTCGNGVVEADKGEACDPKDAKTQIGCSNDCRHTGADQKVSALSVSASICGSGSMGSGKDCDIRIAANVKDPSSALLCSPRCLHSGSPLSSAWCGENRLTKGGFSTAEFDAACAKSFSQCGNGVQEPEEDIGCDTAAGWNSSQCTEYCLKKIDKQCAPSQEGCDDNGRLIGSSLQYSQPSVCGDGVAGIGEVPFCEANLVSNGREGLLDPWTLAIGRGLGAPTGTPPTQRTSVRAVTTQNTGAGSASAEGSFAIACGFATDLECQENFGSDYGVDTHSCCTLRPKLLSTYPKNNVTNVCPNTYLEAVFNMAIDPETLSNGITIARGAPACSDSSQDVTNLVAHMPKTVSGSWLARTYGRVSRIFRRLVGTPVDAVSERWCVAQDAGKAEVLPAPDVSPSASRVRISLKSPLAKNADYAVIISNAMKTKQGVAVSAEKGKPVVWSFTTIDQLCELKSVTVEPKEWSFTRALATTTLVAKAIGTNGAEIQGIPGLYDWKYVWGPQNDASVMVRGVSSSAVITAQNRNGETMVRASAQLTENTISTATGTVAAGQSRVIVLLCENPWPPKDLYIQSQGPYSILPFEDALGNNDGFDVRSNTFNNTPIPASPVTRDGYFNFSTYYCADKGLPGTFDDLPFLRGTVQISPAIVSPTTSLKRFLFTNTKNNDVVGIQVFPNPKHLTALEWYSLDKGRGGQGFAGNVQPLQVNGFEAVSDGNNVYIDGLNYSAATQGLFSNIYLLSVNENATPDTRAVFEQLLKNFKLTVNVANYGYCAAPGAAPDFSEACRTDFDCSGGRVCSATVDKFKRNYERLRGLGFMYDALSAYAARSGGTYPDIAEGTFLKGQAVSTWPSWSQLGSALGMSSPATDPINLLGSAGTCSVTVNRFCTTNSQCPAQETCVTHEKQTGWSTADRRFSFACSPSSLAYRYMAVSSTGYVVRARLEDPGVPVANLGTLINDFVDPTKFILTGENGICTQAEEISTLNTGRCGDGVVNYVRGEECDPAGTVRYGTCSAEMANKVRVDVCDSSCRFVPSSTPYIACSALSSCGNGKLEAGEQCDEGVLNGTYNHCSKTCTWPPASPPGYCGDGQVQNGFETCDFKSGLNGKNGLCAEGALRGSACSSDADCLSMTPFKTSYGRCQLFTPATGRYGFAEETSCSLDCRSSGPRCGDGVVQTAFGEECDGAKQCSVGGISGTTSCSPTCRITEPQAAVWWRFDDRYEFTVNGAKVISYTDEQLPPERVGTISGQQIASALVCTTEGTLPCPTLTNGKYGRAIQISSGGGGLMMTSVVLPASQINALNVSSSALTIELWLKVGSYVPFGRVFEKGTASDGGYALRFDSTGKYVIFETWDRERKNSFSVTGTIPVPFNQWVHVAATLQIQGTAYTGNLYTQGALEATAQKISTVPLLRSATNDSYAFVGMEGNRQNILVGSSIDELKIHPFVLSAAEIASRATEFSACNVQAPAPALSVVGPQCGDAKVDPGEACDRGVKNGVACIPDYNKTCSYCALDCKNIIDVQAKQYCGNSVIEGPEVCEAVGSGDLFSARPDTTTEQEKNADRNGYRVLSCANEPKLPYTIKKGTKTCASACSLVQSNCVLCGKDDVSGVSVSGALINVLNPNSKSPLSASANATLHLTLSNSHATDMVAHSTWPLGASYNAFALRPPNEDGYNSPNLAKLGTDSRCSFGDGPVYTMYINGDDTHPFTFPVYAKPSPWQYDMVVSPVISRAQRANDIRVVMRYVGNAVDFIPGFLHSIAADGTPRQTEGGSMPLTQTQAYWSSPSYNGLWFHGAGSTPGSTHVAAFTIDSSALSSGRYVLYVRVPQSNPADPGIFRYAGSARLQVEVYFPEDDNNSSHFAKPSLIYYMNQATTSDNPSAPYWQVLELKTDPSITQPQNRVVPLQKITTKPYLPL